MLPGSQTPGAAASRSRVSRIFLISNSDRGNVGAYRKNASIRPIIVSSATDGRGGRLTINADLGP